jgi:cytochrome c2
MTHHEHHLAGCAAVCFAGLLAFAAAIGGLAFAMQRGASQHIAPTGYLGDPERGRGRFSAYGCPACHDLVAPPLDRIAAQPYIAGRFPNTEIDMIEWIRFPRETKPGTAMPDLGVSERDARDIAAYLATRK